MDRPPGRDFAGEVVSAAFAALWLPFTWVAGVPAALARRMRRSADRSAQAAARAQLDVTRWTPELLARIEWRRLEALCDEYFDALGLASSTLVHVIAWQASSASLRPLRALREAMRGGDFAEGVLVSSGRFTQEARDFAAQERIRLVEGAELLAGIAALAPAQAAALLAVATQGEFLTPTCIACDVKMISRRSTHEGRKHWGCPNYPACKQTIFSVANAPG